MAMMFHASIPLCYWDEMLYDSSFIINRFSTTTFGLKSSLKMLFKTKLDYNYLRMFMCLCYLCFHSYSSYKLEPRFLPGTFLGYNPRHKGYKCLFFEGKIYIS